MIPVKALRSGLVALTALVALLLGTTPRAAADVANPFREYYNQHQGMRVLGYPLTDLIEVNGLPAQYFEKGRIEDHRSETRDPNWAFMYGRLTVDLMERDPRGAVNATSMSYAELRQHADPRYRHAPPAELRSGTVPVAGGTFVPFDPQLRRAPGYVVPTYFWRYINRADLFPGGWLHDIGLPMTDLLMVQTVKQKIDRTIWMQAFERTVLTYDPQNPSDWQIERGNIGADALRTVPSFGTVSVPALNARVTLPLHIFMRGGASGERVTATLRWQDGTLLSQQFTLLRGEDGRGLLIDNLDWINMLTPPEPRTQPATLEIRSQLGDLLARQPVIVLSPSDPATQTINVYWVMSGTELVTPQLRHVPRTERIGTAALEELLWGPPMISQIGFQTALPTPQQVLSYPGREPDWGPRVTLRKLTIEEGIATADFSQELRAYGGGSTRVMLIVQQIRQTLWQFPSVEKIRIAIEGETEGVLQP